MYSSQPHRIWKTLGKIPDDMPFTYDGKNNYLFRLEALPQNLQLQYLRNHLPPSQTCALDLATPRSSNGNIWLSQFLDLAGIIRSADEIFKKHQHTEMVKEKL